jgi:hypothetical protein
MSTRIPTNRCSIRVGVGCLALLGCAPIPSPPDAGPRARPVVDVTPPPADIPIDRAPIAVAPTRSLLANLPPIPMTPPPPGTLRRRRVPPGTWAAAWTDNAAIRRLASSCRFQPLAPRGTQGGDPLHCATYIAQQSHAVDPCFDEVETPCRVTCGDACSTCDTTCRAACSECRAPCTTPACIYACATRCGRCLQTCIDTRDHCLIAGCALRRRVCRERLIRRYREGGCAAECLRCYRACDSTARGSGCFDACLNRSTRCDAEGRTLCQDGGPGYGQDEFEQGGTAN